MLASIIEGMQRSDKQALTAQAWTQWLQLVHTARELRANQQQTECERILMALKRKHSKKKQQHTKKGGLVKLKPEP